MNEIQFLIQGGAVGIAIALIFLVWKISQECSRNARSIMGVVEQNAKALQGLTDSIHENTKVTEQTRDMLKSVTKMHKAIMQAHNGHAR